MEDRDYKSDISIDPFDLEKEWLEQPSLFLYYSEAYADAAYERDRRKAKMEYTYSKLYSEVKSNWKEYFESKPTEAACKEWVISHKEYRKAEINFIKATKSANILSNVKTAFEHRKLALSNLTSLRIGGFYSEPRNKQRDVDNLRNAQKRSLREKRLKRRK